MDRSSARGGRRSEGKADRDLMPACGAHRRGQPSAFVTEHELNTAIMKDADEFLTATVMPRSIFVHDPVTDAFDAGRQLTIDVAIKLGDVTERRGSNPVREETIPVGGLQFEQHDQVSPLKANVDAAAFAPVTRRILEAV